MATENRPFERAMRLAVVTGLRSMLGPALVAAAGGRPERKTLAMAALGELVVDKMPLVPSRSSLPLLIPRALAGAWVAKTVMEEAGEDNPWAAPMGAAVAVGAATFAPQIRGLLRRVLGVPDFVVGAAEDYLAIKVGSEAVGMSMDDVRRLGSDTVEEIQGHLMPAVRSAAQSLGAGSM